MRPLLLDTCALIWLINGVLDDSAARPHIEDAGAHGVLFVSTTTAWEIGLLSRTRLEFLPDPKSWFAAAIGHSGLSVTPITAAIAIDSSHLPGTLHSDPADRLIIATARHITASIVTRDRRILEYGEAGYVSVLTC